MHGTDMELPPSLSHVTPAFRTTLENMSELARQHVALHIIPDSWSGCTVSPSTGESVQDVMGKQCSIGKSIRKGRDRGIYNKSSSDDEGPEKCKRTKKALSSKTTPPSAAAARTPCFLCGKRAIVALSASFPRISGYHLTSCIPIYTMLRALCEI